MEAIVRYHHLLDDVMGQKSKLRILRHLATTRLELNGRQIAADIGMSPWVCHQALKELDEQGVLVSRNVGKAHLYRLNEQNYLVAELILPFFQKEKGLLDAALSEITAGLESAVLSIVLYGSVLRGEESPSSDLDLLVIVPTAEDRKQVQDVLARKGSDFAARFGNLLAPALLTVAEFRARYRQQDPFITEVVTAGRVICGQNPAAILSEEVG